MEQTNSDFWRCTVGSAFGLALALVWIFEGPLAFLGAVVLTILGGVLTWFFGRIFMQ